MSVGDSKYVMSDKETGIDCHLKRDAEQLACGGVLQREGVHEHLAGLTKTRNNNENTRTQAKRTH